MAWLRRPGHRLARQRSYVTPDDLRGVALPLLRHRLILNPEAQLDGIQIDALITALLDQVPVPRSAPNAVCPSSPAPGFTASSF